MIVAMLNWFKRRKQTKKSYLSNEEWLELLASPADEKAVGELRKILVRGLKPALYKYVDRELDQFVEDTVQDSLVKILDKLDSFRGESRFTTWAMKVAVREGLSELRRKKWQDVSIDDLASAGIEDDDDSHPVQFAADNPGPDRTTHESMVLEKVMEIIENDLSDKQKMALNALMVEGISSTVVADQMGMKRNALYKLVHDARVKLKTKLASEGIDPDKLLEQLS